MVAMAVIGWLVVSGVVAVLSVLWWIVAPFYLRRAGVGGKSLTWTERVVTVLSGVGLGCAWWFVVVGMAPFSIVFK